MIELLRKDLLRRDISARQTHIAFSRLGKIARKRNLVVHN